MIKNRGIIEYLEIFFGYSDLGVSFVLCFKFVIVYYDISGS